MYVPKCIHFGWCAGIPGVISSAPTEITLSAVRLRRRRRLQEKFLDLISSSLLVAHQQSVTSPHMVDMVDSKFIECSETNYNFNTTTEQLSFKKIFLKHVNQLSSLLSCFLRALSMNPCNLGRLVLMCQESS